MRSSFWRVFALAAIVAGMFFVLYQMTLPVRDDFGVTFILPRGAPGILKITSVKPGSPADAAGLRPGDTVAYGDSAVERANVIFAPPGSHVHVIVNGTRPVTFTARALPPGAFPWALLVVRLAFLIVAALLAWRLPHDRAARTLIFFLLCYGIAIGLSNGNFPAPIVTLVVDQILTLVLLLAGTAAVARFSAIFPSGTAKPLPRKLAATAQILSAATALAIGAGVWFPRNSNAVSSLAAAFFAVLVVIGLIVVATLFVAYAQSEPQERQRRRWVFLLLGVGLSGPLIDLVVAGVFGFQPLVDELALLPLAVLPFGLAYIILRHRVLDVGFVLNRALVFTGVSALIVGAFVVVETLAAKFIETRSHVESLALELAVALGLGFSIRFIHARVDRFVDTVFFRDRHRADTALREFAHDAAYVTQEDILLDRCVAAVRQHGGASAAGVWITPDGRVYAPSRSSFDAAPVVDENDPGVVAMRARHITADLRECGSALPGVIGFPMIVRGDLLGILVCGPKRDDETYAPDERETLASLATNVGFALDAMEVRELRRRLNLAPRARLGADATRGDVRAV